MVKIKKIDELKQILVERNILIYGAGYVAQRFFNALKQHGLSGNVKSFVTSSKELGELDGIPVQSLDKVNKYLKPIILIAVHDTLVSQIEDNLRRNGYDEYVCIYPFLYDMMLGKSTICDVGLNRIWNANNDKINLPARYLAIAQYYGKNNYGYTIYKKAIYLLNPSSVDVVGKRLEAFIQLIENCEKNNYDHSKTVSVLENGLIVDGAHRISLALYHNLEKVKCKVYKETVPYSIIHDPASIPAINDAVALGFTVFEKKMLMDVNDHLNNIYKK